MTEQNVHRFLDLAFAGGEPSPEVQDLKDEIRANLLARVAELTAAGQSADEAMRAAIAEVGDLRAAVAEVAGGRPPRGPAAQVPVAADSRAAHQRLAAAHRVRPRPAFVVATVVLSALLAVALVVVALAALDVVALSWRAATLRAVAAALLAGGIVALALRQETTTHYPMPTRRAAAWAAATTAGVLALGLGALFAGDTSLTRLLEAALVLAVGAVAALVALAVTQTNRTKGWVREAANGPLPGDRFTQDPAAAARFGLYSAVLWLLALAAVVVVGLTAGWTWCWTPLVVAVLIHLVLLARMQFPPARG